MEQQMPSPTETFRITISSSELSELLPLLDSVPSTTNLLSFKKKLVMLSLKVNNNLASPVYVKSNVDRKSVSMDKLGFSDAEVKVNQVTKIEPTEDDFA